MPATLSPLPCPECRGRGSILLLVNTVVCTRCGGKGKLPATVLDVPISELTLRPATCEALRQIGVSGLRDLVRLSERDLRARKGINEAIIADVKKGLSMLGLSLRTVEPLRVAQP